MVMTRARLLVARFTSPVTPHQFNQRRIAEMMQAITALMNYCCSFGIWARHYIKMRPTAAPRRGHAAAVILHPLYPVRVGYVCLNTTLSTFECRPQASLPAR